MTNPIRLLLIVLPIVLLPLITNAQLHGKIDILPDETTYQVSLVPTINWTTPLSITNSAQVTLRAETGTFVPTNIQNYTGVWILSASIISPPDAPGYDYFSYSLNAPLSNTDYSDGQELVLFTVENADPCIPVELFDNTNDPFLPPNSLSINIGTAFTVLGAGPGVNAYIDNLEPLAECDPPPPVFIGLQADINDLPCAGGSTNITVNAIGGEEPYQVAWENTSNGTNGDGQIMGYEGAITFFDFPAGSYSFRITDNNGLMVQEVLIISEPSPISFSLTSINADCLGTPTGQITIENLEGGTVSGNYTFSWSTTVSQMGTLATNLDAGLYSLTISDDNGCSAEEQVEVECNPPPVYMGVLADVGVVPCVGGTAVITVNAIQGEEPYQVSWENTLTGTNGSGQINDYEGSIIFSDFPAGTYSFTLTDNNNLTVEEIIFIGEPDPISFNLDPSKSSCEGANNGQIIIRDLAGGTVSNDYTYTWSPTVNQTDSVVTNLAPGIYMVTIFDDNGCTMTGETEIEIEYQLEPSPDVANVSCFGADDGVINLYSSGSSQPFIFNWSGNGYTGDESSAWGLSGGMYYFTITDNSGFCAFSDSILVNEPAEISMEYDLTNPTCQSPNEAFIYIEKVSNTQNGYQFSTNGSQFFDDPEFMLNPGENTNIFIKDGNGCITEETVYVPEYELPQILMEEEQFITLGEQIQLNPTVFPTSGLTLTWTPAETLSCDDCPEPTAKPIESTTYRLSAIDSSGCRDDGSITIYVKKEKLIYAPNAFSPNNDGINDYFTLFTGVDVKAIHSLRVFNRWGEMVFESAEDFEPNVEPLGWDGQFNGQDMREGVYIFSALVEYEDGIKEVFSGEVNILR